MTTGKELKLFTSVQLGAIALGHRVVMAPLTRSRSEQPDNVPGALMMEYYGQRASEGGFIISEATNISISSRGWYGAPGIYTDAQVAGWKKIVDVVHAKGGQMFSQLWHTGRSSHIETTGGLTPVSASVNPDYWNDKAQLISAPSGWIQPSPHRALEIGEIAGIVEDYRKAAERAKEAGFDGVELHGANGYLVDQFLQGVTTGQTFMAARSRTGRGFCWR
jgi:N-ethylmaleimide reductase